jgi:hypothetical protein
LRSKDHIGAGVPAPGGPGFLLLLLLLLLLMWWQVEAIVFGLGSASDVDASLPWTPCHAAFKHDVIRIECCYPLNRAPQFSDADAFAPLDVECP